MEEQEREKGREQEEDRRKRRGRKEPVKKKDKKKERGRAEGRGGRKDSTTTPSTQLVFPYNADCSIIKGVSPPSLLQKPLGLWQWTYL